MSNVQSPVDDSELTPADAAAARLEPEPEAAFDSLTRLAARCLKAPVALLSMGEGPRQLLKSAVGLDAAHVSQQALAFTQSFCADVASSRAPVGIADAREAEALRDHPAVKELRVLACAGAALVSSTQHGLGALCVLDYEPRAWTSEQLAVLDDLARTAAAQLELRLAHRSLRARQAMFSALTESANDACVTTDAHGRIIGWNAAAERMFGYTFPQVSGRALTMLMPERYHAAHAASLAHISEGEAARLGSTLEVEALRKSREEFPVEFSLSRWCSGEGTFFTGVLRDITARKLHSDALRRSEEQFRLTIDHAPIGMALVGLDGRFLRVNRAMCQLVGYDAERLATLTLRELTHPDDLAMDSDLERQLTEGRIPRYQLAKRYIRQGGFVVDAMLYVSLVRDGSAVPQYFIAQIEDVTAKKRAEAELQHKSMILESVLVNMNDAVVVASLERELLLINPAAERTFEDPESARICAWTNPFALPVSDELAPPDEEPTPMLRALRGEKVDQHEVFVRTPTHPEGRWHSVTASPLRRADGAIWGGVTVSRDVTHLKRAELALREQSSIIRLLEAVAAAANEAPTSKRAMQECLRLVCEFMDWPVGHVYTVDGTQLLPSELWHLGDRVKFATFREVTSRTHLVSGLDLPGRVLATGKPAWMQDVQTGPGFLRAHAVESLGVHGGFAFPLLLGDEVVAVLEFYSERPEVPDARALDVMQHVATQLGRVVERERHAQAVRNLSLTDELTSLNNRRGFLALAESQLRLSVRSAKPCLLIFVDMDGLKQINDEFGHETGDAALLQLSKVMRQVFRESDIIGRLGGDEFVALLPDVPEENASIVLGRLQENLTLYNVTHSRGYVLAASAGVTAFDPKRPATIEDLLAEADNRMYEQKRRRKVSPRPSIIVR